MGTVFVASDARRGEPGDDEHIRMASNRVSNEGSRAGGLTICIPNL
jgi:hypothetical protein